jgi:hypothetical protein
VVATDIAYAIATCAQFFSRVSGAAQFGVVHQKGHAIGAELYIALKHPEAVAGTEAEGGQGVFGG